MKTSLQKLAFLYLFLIWSTSSAQTFVKPSYTTDYDIYTSAVRGDTLILGGNFNNIGIRTGGIGLVSTQSDIPDANFPIIDGQVYASVSDGKGGWYVSGKFLKEAETTPGGYTISRIEHILPNNTFDPDFSIIDNNAVYIKKLTIFNNKLYIAGSTEFSSFMGRTISCLVALDLGTKKLTDWSPVIKRTKDVEVNTLLINNNTLYIGGWFSEINGEKRDNLAAFDLTTGNLKKWNPQFADNPGISDLCIYNDKLIVGGGFGEKGVVFGGNSCLLIDTNTGTEYSFLFNASSTYWASGVDAIEVSGNTLFAKSTGTYDTRIVAYDLVKKEFLWKRYFNMIARVKDMKYNNGTLYIAGMTFDTYYEDRDKTKEISKIGNVFAIDPKTGSLRDWTPSPSGIAYDVYTLSFWGDKILIGGTFGQMKSVNRYSIVMYDTKNRQPLLWDAGFDYGSSVSSIKLFDNKLYFAGGLNGKNDKPYSNLAAFDLKTGKSLDIKLPILKSGRINVIEADNERLYIGGSFEIESLGKIRKNLVVLDRKTGEVIDWSPNPDREVNTLKIQDKILYVGGGFLQISGQERKYLVSFDTPNLGLTTWNPNANGFVNDLVLTEKLVYVGGGFTMIGTERKNAFSVIDLKTGKPKATDPFGSLDWGVEVKTIQLKGNYALLGGNFLFGDNNKCNNLLLVDLSSGVGTRSDRVCVNVEGYQNSVYKLNFVGNDLYFAGRFWKTNQQYIPNLGIIRFPQGFFDSAKPTTPTITATSTTICTGSSITLTSTACTGGTLTWTGGATGNSITISPTSTKSYNVVCSVKGVNSDSSTAVKINVNAKPTQPKITASNANICVGSSSVLTSTACTGGTLTWTGGATGSSITVSPTISKSYKVVCTQGTCKSDSSLATTITVTPKPTQPKITASNSTICSGGSTVLTSTSCTGGALTWTGGATGSSITVSPTISKSYKVVCTQGTCKSDSSLATTITVIPKPTQPKITASNSTICSGSSVTLTSTACTGGTLTWTGGATGSSITVSPTISKSYKVLCTQGTCKSDSSVATTITVTPKPTQPKITASNSTICVGSSVTLTSTACTGGTSTWTGGVTGSSITVSSTATKSYKVLCTQGTCKSDSSVAVTITVNPLPVSPKVTSNTICNNPVSVLRDISFGGENTDYLSSTCLSQDGSLVMVGNSTSSNKGDKSQASKGGSDYWVVKVNAVGTKVWDKTFGGSGDDAPTSILATSDGGFLISGYSNSPKSGDKSEASKGGYDYWLVKIDANGTKVWDKVFGGTGSDYATSIISTSDNNFLLVGHSDSEIGGNKSVGTKGSLDYWIVKIKPDGTKLWDKSYGGSGVDNLVSVVSTKDGGFLLAGHSSSIVGGDKTESSKGNYDYWVLKIDANGTKVWDKSYGALSQEELSSITPTFDGGFILGGISNSSIGGDKTEPLMGGFDYWIVKINTDGTKLWDKVFGGSDTEYFAKVLPTADGGCLLGGTSYSPISGNKFEASLNGDFWLVKISSKGSRAWDKVIGGNSADVLKDMFMGDNGTVILSGYSFSDIGINKSQPSRGSSDYWTVYAQVCDNSYKPYTNLVATGCTGVVTWSNNATGNTIAVSPAVGTNYTATCKVNGCLSSPSNVIAVSPAKPATPSIAASNTSICAGSSIVLSSSNSPNGIITWTGGLKGNSITISPTVTKTYKSICSINGINSDSSNSITITVIPQPTQPKITASNSTICQGSSTTLTASACTGGILTWTGGLTGSSITVSPTATKSYKVLCTQNYCKSDSSVATTITVTTKPQAPVISSKANYSSNNANTQWNKTFGGIGEENITSIISCADGGALLGGYSTSNVSADKSESSKGVYDYWVIRIDADGKKLWDKTLGGGNYDYLTSIVTTADGGFLLGGYSLSNKSGDKSENSKGDKDYWIVKIDKNGQKVWDKTFGGLYADVLTSIISTSDGGFLLGGHSLSYVGGDKTETNKGNHDYWVVKIDANGNKLWDKTFGGASNDYLYGMTTTTDGGFLLGGYSGSNKSGDKSENIKGWNDYWIVKIDAKGNKVWDKTIGGDGGDTFSSLINTSDGGFLLAGYSSSNQSGDKSANAKGNADYWIVKIDASGNKLWDKTFGGNSLDQLNAVFKTSDGGFLLGGYSQSSINGDKTENTKGNYDYWVVRIDALGNKLWDKTIGGNDNDQFSSMTLMKDGSFLLGGNSNSKASYDKSENAKGGFDYWLIKIKENQIKSTTSLTSTGCTGTTTWSNGATTNSITVSPTIATTYTATCTVNTCKSAASNAITVSPDVVPNGRIETTVAIESEPSFNFKVFPNPAKDELTIQTDLEGEATFYLYNSIGQKVLEKTFEKQTKIDLKNLTKGSHIYLIQHDKTQTSGKILLE